MVSGTLNRTTEEITKVRRALGNRFAGLFDHMPPHTPRHAVIEAAEMAREARADLIVTVGGGSTTDGAKAVQLCLANDVRNAEAIDGLRPLKGPDGALGPPPHMKPPSGPQVTVPATLACRWGRDLGSAMCSAPCSTSHTATPRALCCRR